MGLSARPVLLSHSSSTWFCRIFVPLARAAEFWAPGSSNRAGAERTLSWLRVRDMSLRPRAVGVLGVQTRLE